MLFLMCVSFNLACSAPVHAAVIGSIFTKPLGWIPGDFLFPAYGLYIAYDIVVVLGAAEHDTAEHDMAQCNVVNAYSAFTSNLSV